MLYFTGLYYAILYSVVLHYIFTIPYYTMLYCTTGLYEALQVFFQAKALAVRACQQPPPRRAGGRGHASRLTVGASRIKNLYLGPKVFEHRIYIHTHIKHMCICVHIYIYAHVLVLCVYTYMYMHIYIVIYIYICM